MTSGTHPSLVQMSPEVPVSTVKLYGRALLTSPLYNRGVAFTHEERERFGLVGKLPPGVLPLEEQAKRAYTQLQRHPTDLAKNIDLEQLHDRNEILYYKVLTSHLTELLPIIYAPTVGEIIKAYSHEYRRPRGIYLSIDRPQDIRPAFESWDNDSGAVDIVVATDAEALLGIGDWGVGGMAISCAKLSVYTAAGGIHPGRVIPVMIDVGTDNETLLNDPWYVGNRHHRVRGDAYDAFIEEYVHTVTELFPHALLHWEDFGPANARAIIEKYGDRICTFNDDMQGTGAVALAALMNAVAVTVERLKDQRIVIYGAGTAGIGIADQLRDAMVHSGATREEASRAFWCIDREGLLLSSMDNLRSFQRGYARPVEDVADWGAGDYGLAEVVRHVHPTVLIGTSTHTGAFTEQIVREMSSHVDRPIIFPMSNPTEKLEARPEDLLAWSNGRALIATGLPFDPIDYNGISYVIAQANNALLFPGLGLGVSVVQARLITDGMFSAAAYAIATQVSMSHYGAPLLPAVANLRHTSEEVGIAVAEQAVRDGVATREVEDIPAAVRASMWEPQYPDLS